MWKGVASVDVQATCATSDARETDMQIWDNDVQKGPRAVPQHQRSGIVIVIYGVGKFQHGITSRYPPQPRRGVQAKAPGASVGQRRDDGCHSDA